MTSKQSESKGKPASRRGSSSRGSNSSERLHDVGLASPILGKNFRVPELYHELPDIELDDSQPYVPIYCHFVVPEIQAVIRPKTPPILAELRAELCVESMQPPVNKPQKASKAEQRSRNAAHEKELVKITNRS